MPELPEVEAARKLAESSMAGKQIVAVYAADDRIVYDGVAPRTVARRLRDRGVRAVHRTGKQLWVELDRPPHLLVHFGMTGSFHVYTSRADRPRFCKLELTMADGSRLGMQNIRRLGRIRLRNDPPREDPIAGLGFDPLLDMPEAGEFAAAVSRRSCPIKSLLLDQSFAAGIGNWIADEVLYHAGIDPHRGCHTLTSRELGRLHRQITRVIQRAVAVDADADRFPAGWLFHVRWGKSPNAQTKTGLTVRFDTIGGRTTAWVPDKQH